MQVKEKNKPDKSHPYILLLHFACLLSSANVTAKNFCMLITTLHVQSPNDVTLNKSNEVKKKRTSQTANY